MAFVMVDNRVLPASSYLEACLRSERSWGDSLTQWELVYSLFLLWGDVVAASIHLPRGSSSGHSLLSVGTRQRGDQTRACQSHSRRPLSHSLSLPSQTRAAAPACREHRVTSVDSCWGDMAVSPVCSPAHKQELPPHPAQL